MYDSEANIKARRGEAANPAGELQMAAMETHALARTLLKSGKRDLERRLEACGVGVGPLGYRVMRLLDEQTSTIAELSRMLRSGAAGLVPVIDTLEAKGLVDRGRDPKDRRRTPLTLTPAGERCLLGCRPLTTTTPRAGSGRARPEGTVSSESPRELVTNVTRDV